MNYTLSVSFQGPYAEAIVTGANTPENVVGYLRELDARCRESRTKAALVVEQLEGAPFNRSQLFDIVMQATADPIPSLRYLAIVDQEYGDNARLMAFAESIALSRGVYARVFPHRRAAATWLTGSTANSRRPIERQRAQ